MTLTYPKPAKVQVGSEVLSGSHREGRSHKPQ